ncbi:MAG: carbohydrate kinase family protein [Promethearchaeota archaeon]
MKSKNLDIICIGAVNLDLVAKIEHFPGPDDQVPILSFEKMHGGSAANTAIACARLGLKTGFIGRLGADDVGVRLSGGLADGNVNVNGIIIDPENESGQVFIAVDEVGERRMFAFPGAPQKLTRKDIISKKDYILKSIVLHLGSLKTSEPHEAAVELTRGLDVILSLNPGSMLASLGHFQLKKILESLDILVLSRHELHSMFQSSSIESSAGRCMMESGVKMVAVTLGKIGSQLFMANYSSDVVPAFDVKVVDTTGAGDAFCAGFFYKFISLLKDIKEKNDNLDLSWKAAFNMIVEHPHSYSSALVTSLAFGNAVAAHVIQEKGARMGIPSAKKVENFLKNFSF